MIFCCDLALYLWVNRHRMKRSILLYLSFLLFSANAQVEYGDFKVDDQQIIYQKIFPHDSITPGKLHDYYKTLPNVSQLKLTPEGVSFHYDDLIVDYKKFQFAQMATPSIIQTGKYSGNVHIGVKDGRYRITVRDIQLTGDINYKKIVEKDNLTSYACRNSGTVLSSDWCRPNMLGLLNQAFTDKLKYVELQAKQKEDSDW